MPGTQYETQFQLKQGASLEPCVMVIGGVHGDEPAGWLAAEELAKWEVTRGLLVVLPRAHQEAIRHGQRGYPGNMNAMFPGRRDGDAMQRLAWQIFEMVKFYRPGLLLTLHESVGFHRDDPHRYGQTLCYDFHAWDGFFQRVLNRVNPDLADPKLRFQLFVEPHTTCPTYQAGSQLSIPATSIETAKVQPLQDRIRQQLMVLMAFFDECGLGYVPRDLPRLSTATQPPGTELGSGREWAP